MPKRNPKVSIPPTKQQPEALVKRQALKAEATELAEAAAVNPDVPAEKLEEIQTSPLPEAKGALDDVVSGARRARMIYETAKATLDEQLASINLERDSLTRREEALRIEQADIEPRKGQLAQREAQLNLEARELQTLRLQAENGFADLEIERRRAFEEEMEKRREASQLDYQRRLSENEALKEQLLRVYEEQSKSLQDKFDERRKQLDERERLLRQDREEIQDREEDLETRLLLLKGRARREVNTELNRLKHDLELMTSDRDSLAERVEMLENELRQLRGQARLFDGMSAEQVAARLRSLDAENRRLRDEVQSRPGQELETRYQELENRFSALLESEASSRAEQARIQRELSRRNVEVITVEGLRDENRSLQAANEAHKGALRELEATVDKYVRKNDEKAVFPACAGMDANTEYQEEGDEPERELDLRKFVTEMRERMASFPALTDRRSYPLEDVRTFVAGMAMSRLHLLQGISGTGKTSLPQAFARALAYQHSNYATIEVQAGWRDRADLVGTYNAFEGRFYESEFLKALYTARTPRHRGMPFFVILDEMNLSHPEQYFADFLSMLEQREGERRLRLTSARVGSKPLGLEEDDHGGLYLPLPENVWFIGTANHDETTKDFADKTYDRAHIMELPRQPLMIDPVEFDRVAEPVSFRNLLNAFQDAEDTYEGDATKAKTFLNLQFSEMLRQQFGLAWGNRLERQIDRFVPVILASGGTLGEALDHVLATKVLRKLTGRYDVKVRDLRDLKEHVELAWLEHGNEPIHSLEQLDKALRAIGAPVEEPRVEVAG